MTSSMIRDLAQHVNTIVLLEGWVHNWRSSGKIAFLQFRDGTGYVQIVYSRGDVSDNEWRQINDLQIESAVRVTGKVVCDERAPSGVEIQGASLERISGSPDYPIANKEHGVDFLLDHRHLWLRSSRPWAVMRVRDTLERATADFLHDQGFVRMDSPILTPNACEGTTDLYEVDHFGRPAYLSQSGQLYLEAGIFAHRRVYDFGPVFRAEKSKTRRHLNEFWMMDAEMAFCDHVGNMALQETLIVQLVERVLSECAQELALLGRDVSALQKVKAPFPRLTHKEAVARLRALGSDIKESDDLGGDDETTLTQQEDRPLFIEKYPAAVKAFYMKQDSDDASRVLCADLLAPEGYGEIIGGSEREVDLEVLTNKIREHGLPLEQFQWYLDLRRYGSVPHSGFGFGLERLVTWMCGIKHVRTAIPFPRTLNRLEP